VSPSRPSSPSRLIRTGLALIAAGVAFAGCAEVESNLVEEQPYTLEAVEGSDIQRIKMGDETASKLDLRTAPVRRAGRRTVVPYSALIYNPDGDTFVYTVPGPETYLRAPVTVRRISGDRVLLSDGPPAGTTIVTVGAAELIATEYEILNQHP
jgi:hypothetical protein